MATNKQAAAYTKRIAELEAQLAEAQHVAAERVGADPEVRQELLHWFGTTEPDLIREAMELGTAQLAEARAEAQSISAKLSEAQSERNALRAEVERLRAADVACSDAMDSMAMHRKAVRDLGLGMLKWKKRDERAEAKLKAVVVAHGPAKRRCACPGCRKMLPACWVSVLCHACATEDCDHAAAKEKP